MKFFVNNFDPRVPTSKGWFKTQNIGFSNRQILPS